MNRQQSCAASELGESSSQAAHMRLLMESLHPEWPRGHDDGAAVAVFSEGHRNKITTEHQ